MTVPGTRRIRRAPILQVSQCSHAFEQPDGSRLRVLDGLNLTVESGTTIAIIGRSGSGKSTLLSVLGLLRTPQSGTYQVDGVDAESLVEKDRANLRASKFGFIFQEYLLMGRHTVRKNIEIPFATSDQKDWRSRSKQVAEVLELVGLSDRADSLPAQLSGGQKQRVAIARALVRNPKIVLADEPTGALDPATADGVLGALVAAVHRRGTALIVVTHDIAVANQMDRQLELVDGMLLDRTGEIL